MTLNVKFGSGGALPVELVSARAADGVLLHGAVAGSGDATAGLLAVHGAWGNFYTSPPSELLRAGPARGLRVLALNSRFHDLATVGDGEPCVGFFNHSFEASVQDLDAGAELLSSLGIRRFVVVAHSYGSHQVALWLSRRPHPGVTGAVLASPGPSLRRTSRAFVDGSLEQHLTEAARAVAAADSGRLIVLGSRGPVPMVAEASTVLETWDLHALTDSTLHVPTVTLPVLVTAGRMEPGAYMGYARSVADAAADGKLMVLDDNHYYSRDRPGFARTVLEWVERRGLLPGVATQG